MRGTERGPFGTLRYFYQYKAGGTKYYYSKADHAKLRLPFHRPFIPKYEEEEDHGKYEEYVPDKPKLSNMESAFRGMPAPVKALITTWMLVMEFQSLDDVSPDAVAKAFRKQALIHHPDKGGREENYKELSNVRDHLLTLCRMAEAMK